MGMLSARRSRAERERVGSGTWEGDCGVWRSAVSSPSRVGDRAPQNFEFGLFWDLKIASNSVMWQ